MTNKTLTLEDLLYFQKTVIEWNEIFGNSVTDKSLIEVYKSLTLEELLGKSELLDSAKSGNKEGVVDGLVDTIYTGFFWGVLNKFTIDAEDNWFRDGSWCKGINDTTFNTSIEYWVESLVESVNRDDVFGFQTNFTILLYICYLDYDLVGAFNRITESNYSKALSKDNKGYTLQECLDSVKEIGRYEDVFVEETNTHYIIKARIDTQENAEYPSGKVVKGVWYKGVESLGGMEEFIK